MAACCEALVTTCRRQCGEGFELSDGTIEVRIANQVDSMKLYNVYRDYARLTVMPIYFTGGLQECTVVHLDLAFNYDDRYCNAMALCLVFTGSYDRNLFDWPMPPVRIEWRKPTVILDKDGRYAGGDGEYVNSLLFRDTTFGAFVAGEVRGHEESGANEAYCRSPFFEEMEAHVAAMNRWVRSSRAFPDLQYMPPVPHFVDPGIVVDDVRMM